MRVRWTGTADRRRRWAAAATRLAVLLPGVLVASLLSVPARAAAAAPAEQPWQVTAERSTPGRDAAYQPAAADPADRAAVRGTRAVTWPGPGAATVTPPTTTARATGTDGRARAGTLPLWVGAPRDVTAKAATSAPSRVRVQLLDTRSTRDRLLLRAARADAATVAGRVSITVDYAAFRHAYGGDWASRLRVLRLPECALTTPDRPACTGTPLATSNDVATGTLTADVVVPAASTTSAAGTLFAVTAGPSGGAGSFAATSLSESATWSAGGSTGDFSWNYPLRVPPAPGGLEPDLSLSYSSASVDGRHSAVNTQPAWTGEGFDLWPGYIERRYKPCADDMSGGANTTKTGDQCWATDNATMSLNGSGGELIRDDATGVWRPKADTGARVEKLTGAVNGDNDGEFWKVTTTDGTQYYFGLNRLPGWTGGNPETNSGWTVPVYGNHAGEPCRGSSFDASFCDQAWRWNLDYVVDRHGDTMSYFYTPERNKYARNITATKVSGYVRGGVLDRVEYGQRDGAVFTTPAVGKVLFTSAERCLPGTACTKTEKQHYPDVPYDQECTGTSCADKWSPTFWTSKRLAKITTQVRSGDGYADVDSWTLRHTYPDPGDGTRAGLWLDGITHTGHVGGQASLPEVTFSGVQKPNRVDGIDGIPAMNWWRISGIHSETGGETTVSYSGPDCAAPGDLPAPATNTRRCLPVRWQPEGLTERLDWFHKYVVTEVAEHDRTSGLRPVVTRYEYVGGAAWRYAESDGLTQEKYKTWAQFRGYGRVITRVGHPDDGPVTKQETLYLRGMHGDRTATGGTKSVQVTASEGGPIDDQEPLAGFTRETVSYIGDTDQVLSRTINDPWLSAPTATAVRSWATTRAYVQGTAAVHGQVTLGDGSIRKTRADNTLTTVNGRPGVLTAADDLGDVATPADDKCIRYEFADNAGRHLLGVTTRVVTYAKSCAANPGPADAMTDTRNYYDGSDTLGAVDRGNLTRTEKMVDVSAGAPVYETTNRAAYDSHGRVIESFDGDGTRTLTAYTPASGGPVTQVVTTNALGHTVTTETAPAWGSSTATIDANGHRTDSEFDPLGRVVKVWQPGRTRGTDSPDVEFAYLIRTDGPNVITTKSLKHDGTYLTSYQLLDGQARERQTQSPAPGGGRVVTDTIYNSRGEVVARNGPYYNDAPPGFSVLIPDVAQLPMRTEVLYDGAGRPTTEIVKVQGVEQWRSTTTYGGDRVHVLPPAGGTPTTTFTDARGQTTELRQYHARPASGVVPTGSYDATTYTYTRRGEPDTVTDPAGNTWRYTYNTRGQKIKDEDPDRGITLYDYDNQIGELRSVTDARGKKVYYEYDPIGRRTATRDGSATGPKLADWTYDTLAKGHLTSSTRYVASAAYTQAVTGYDEAYRPLGTRVTIPSTEGTLAGTYEYSATYHGDGSPATSTAPAVGGLPAETLTYGYDSAFSLPDRLTSNLGSYVTASTYTPYGEPWQVTTSTDPFGATNRVTTSFEYQTGTRRLGRTVVERDASPARLSNALYTWDPAGNLTKISDQATGIATDTQCFRYDILRRLTDAWTPASGNCTTAPSASALGGPAPYYQSWTHDKTGNRLTQTSHATAGNTVATSTYPAAGTAQPHTLRSVTTTGPGGSRQDLYTYDTAGNTLTRNIAGTTQNLEWDTEGRLATVTEAGKTTSFVYDANGVRLLRRDDTGTTLYLGPDELFMAAGGAAVTCTRYYSHQGRTVAVRTSGGGTHTLYWLAADHHGTNAMAIKASDLSIQRRYSTPYGEQRGTAPASWPGEKGFVGGTKDAATGLTHLGAREYDPVTGRFISVDPIIDPADPQQMNGYSYANNAPTSSSDPDGLRPMTDEEWYGPPTVSSSPPPQTTPAKSQPSPKPKKCGTFDLICKGKKTAKAVGNFVAEHKATIITVAVSVAAGIGCGIVTAGAAAVACAVAVGAVIGAAEYHFTTPPDKRSVGGYFGAAAIGAASAVVGAGIGKAVGAAVKAGAKAVGQGAKTAAQQSGKAASTEAKAAAKSATNEAKKPVKAAGRKPSDCNSFVPDAGVLMADGSAKSIEDVELGDLVVATDPETGVTQAEAVAALITGVGEKRLVRISVDVDGGDGTEVAEITATDGHPFWLPELSRWVTAGNLERGQWLRTASGSFVQIVSIELWTERRSTVHNLTVADVHTYYVLAGNSPVLVHNCGEVRQDIIDETVEHGERFVNRTSKKFSASFISRHKITMKDAMATGRAFLGDGAREVAPGVFRNGRRGFRMDPASVQGKGHWPNIPHVHFELFDDVGKPIANNHVPLMS